MEFVNGGKTPGIRAKMLRTHRTIELTDPIPVFEEKWPEGDQPSYLALPNLKFGSQQAPIDGPTLTRLRARKCRVIQYGLVRYFDVSDDGVEHVTESCVELVYRGSSVEKGPKGDILIDHWASMVVGNQNRAT